MFNFVSCLSKGNGLVSQKETFGIYYSIELVGFLCGDSFKF